MIENHKYYEGLSTADLVELLTEATQKYLSLDIGESERTLKSYRELLDFLFKEIQQRSENKNLLVSKKPVLPVGDEAVLLDP